MNISRLCGVAASIFFVCGLSIASDNGGKPQAQSVGQSPRLGEFAQIAFGTFDPLPGDETYKSGAYFGQALQDSWLYAHLHSKSGKVYIVYETVNKDGSSSLSIRVTGTQGLAVDPRAGKMDKRTFEQELDPTGGLTFKAIGPSGTFSARINDERFSWSESKLLDVSGASVGPGIYELAPWRLRDDVGATLYTAQFYQADGTIFGEPVTGFVGFDQSYSRYKWRQDPIFTQLQGAWLGFSNEYEDGSIESGHVMCSMKGYTGAVIVEPSKVVLRSPLVKVEDLQYKKNGAVSRAVFNVGNGEQWEFLPYADSDSAEILAALSKGVLIPNIVQGTMLRVGEKRKVRRSWGSLEVFADRVCSSENPGN